MSLFVCLLVGWLVGWLVSQSVSFVCFFVLFVFVDRLVSKSVSQLCLFVLKIFSKQYILRCSSLRNFVPPFFRESNCKYDPQPAVLRYLQSAFSPYSRRPGFTSIQNYLQSSMSQKSKQLGLQIRELSVPIPIVIGSHPDSYRFQSR